LVLNPDNLISHGLAAATVFRLFCESTEAHAQKAGGQIEGNADVAARLPVKQKRRHLPGTSCVAKRVTQDGQGLN